MSKLIIGVAGKIGSGKSWISGEMATVIRELLPAVPDSAHNHTLAQREKTRYRKVTICHTSISYRLKQITARVSGINMDKVIEMPAYDLIANAEDYSHESKNIMVTATSSVGMLLQSLGLEMRNAFGVYSLIAPAIDAVPQFDFVVIDGVRYQSDVEYIHSQGGIVIEVIGSHVKGDSRDHLHPSEHDIGRGYDYCIMTDAMTTKASVREDLKVIMSKALFGK